MKISHVEVTHVGLTRKENQDSVFAIPENGVFLVADGMGGEKAGAEASAQVVTTVNRLMSEYFARFTPQSPADLEKLARKALELASNDILRIAAKNPEKTGMGSTGSLLLMHRGAYFIAQVGDSRIYLLRKGKVQQLTRDHTIVWTLYESGILTRSQLETHPERHLLTQCIGGAKPVEVELFADRVQEGDLFLICSDGLTGYAGEDRVIKLLSDPVYNLDEMGQRLLQAALEGGGGDNVSVVLARVEKLEPGDDWTLEGNPTPKFAPAVVPPPPKPEAPVQLEIGRPMRHRVGLYSMLFFVIALFLLAVAIARKRKEYVEVEFQTAVPLDIGDVVIYDAEGNVLDEVGAGLVVGILSFTAPKNAEYRITVDNEGIVPVDETIDFSGYEGEPIKVLVLEYGTLEIEPSATSPIQEMSIAELAPPEEGSEDEGAEVDTVYEYPNAEDGSPRLNHLLKPRTPHKVTIKDAAGRVMSFTVEVQPGRTESISAEL